MSATNGRVEAADILSARDALLGAAEAADRAIASARVFERIEDTHPQADGFRDYHATRAAMNAQVAEALCSYAATVGRWAAR
jgi:hypothetical protein